MNQKQIEELLVLIDRYAAMQSVESYDAQVNVRDAIEARLSESIGWRPIETAPKDVCTEFDGWNGERVTDVSWGWPEYHPKDKRCWIRAVYETGYGWITEEVHGLTHWMKKPEAPQ